MTTATAKASRTKFRFRPLDDRILIEPSEAEEITAGGIVLPDTAREKPQKGKVLAVGPGKLLEDGTRASLGVKEGDLVFYGRYAGTDVQSGPDTYVVVRESDILAVFEE